MITILNKPYEKTAIDIVEGRMRGEYALEKGLEELDEISRFDDERDCGINFEKAKWNYALLLVCLEDLDESRFGFSVTPYKSMFDLFMRSPYVFRRRELRDFKKKNNERGGGRGGVSKEEVGPGIRVVSLKSMGLEYI